MIEATLPKAFIENAKTRSDRPFLFFKSKGAWQSVSWKEAAVRVKYMSLGLMSLGVKKGDRVAPISNTVPEMAYCCLSIATTGAIFAPIYHTNSPKECAHVIKDSQARIAVAEDKAQLEKLKKIWDECPNIEQIIVFSLDQPDSDPRVITLDSVIESGREYEKKNGDKSYYERAYSIESEDATAIIYTSGTTGAPKGAIFTNGGIIKQLSEHVKVLPVDENSVGISFLPMAHALELMDGHWRHVLFGFGQIYAQSLKTIYDDVREMRPTFLFQTPRFYEKIYNDVITEIEGSSPEEKKRAYWCLSVGERYQDLKDSNRNGTEYDLVSRLNAYCRETFFDKVNERVGGRIEWGGCGGAPVPAKVLQFFKSCGFPIYEGYGLTESQGVVTQSRPGVTKVGSCGKAMPDLEIKIAQDGEILVKGWARCAGYWNNPEATKELFEGGWLHTGDLGYLDEDGFLTINGRKKEIIITSSGKNITPSNIQNLLRRSNYISEAIIFGEGQPFVVALVTLNEENVILYAKEKNLSTEDIRSFAKHPAIIDLIRKEIDEKNQELARIEQVKEFTILEEQLRQDRDELTPTLKVKRRVVEQRYKDLIDAMYRK